MSVEVKHYKNGNIKSIEITNEKGDLHNTEGPATQGWYENGQEEYRVYWVNDCPHNTEGPAQQDWYENGQERYRTYYVDGTFHNTEGPTYQAWYRDGQKAYSEYRLNGKELTKEEWEKKVNSVEIECEGKTITISRESAKALNLI